MIRDLYERANAVILPWWVKLAALAVLTFAAYGMGRLDEARHAATEQATAVQVIVKRQVQTVTKTETVYRDRIKKIYVRGEQRDAEIPKIVTPDVDRAFPLSRGFVRVLDAAWAGTATGPAADSDRERSPVPASVVAANESDNATSCKVWRTQALGWRAFYAEQQRAINGKAGTWADRAVDDQGNAEGGK